MHKDITFKVNHRLKRFDSIRGNIDLRAFFDELLFNAENIDLHKLWHVMSIIESLIDKVFELEEELKDFKEASVRLGQE